MIVDINPNNPEDKSMYNTALWVSFKIKYFEYTEFVMLYRICTG